MMAKIFLTGASGYIGGDLLHLLTKAHPEYSIRALVRNAAHAGAVQQVSNSVQTVQGTLDDLSVVAREASEADVVVNLAAQGHIKSVEAIHKSLVNKCSPQKSPYWIQISGGSAVAAAEVIDQKRQPGTPSDTIWNDVEGVEDIRAVIKKHPHRVVDNYIMEEVAHKTPQVKTAVIMPPIIYGPGRGPVNRRSVQIPDLAKQTLKRRRGLQVGPGQSRWGNIHIRDLSQMFLQLVERAVEGNTDKNIWGTYGLYLAGVGELKLSDISKRVAAAAEDLHCLSDTSIEELDGQKFEEILPHGNVLYGTNCRNEANRARKYLGWTPTHDSMEHDIPRTVTEEARSLGLIPGGRANSPHL